MTEQPNPASTAKPLAITGCLAALNECCQLVAQLDENQYAKPLPGHSSIGAHMRHCLDHFLCLLRGLADGEVDYDSRDRNEVLERSPKLFEETVSLIKKELLALCDQPLEGIVHIRQIPAPGNDSIVFSSTLERELVFLSSHCIHHLALMKLMAEIHGVCFEKELGVAFSTAAYRDKIAREDRGR